MPRLWVPLVLAAIAVLVVACGSAGGDPGSAERTSSTVAEAGGGPAAATAADRRGRRRPGCGKFCRQAGGFGGGPSSGKMPVAFRRRGQGGRRQGHRRPGDLPAQQEVRRGDPGQQCALRVRPREPAHSRPQDAARSSCRCRGRASAISRRHGRDRGAFATVPLIYRHAALSFSGRLTLLPPADRARRP